MAQRSSNGRKKEQQDSPQIKSNLSGLKHALHGTSYQLKLGIVVCLANAKKSLNPANGFSFEMTAEDPTAGKFDDIVYKFKDGEMEGILNIQVKHKLGSPAPNISLSDFTITTDTKNPFAILKYFTSFYDQQHSTTDLEGFVICTNADMNEKAMSLWKTVEPTVPTDLAPSLDSYVSSLFDRIGGKSYELDYDKLWNKDGMFSEFHKLLRKCSKRSRLAKILVEATKPKKTLTCNNSLVKEFRSAILSLIDRNETSTNDSYKFTKEFLVLSSSKYLPGYEAFRTEFEDQYRQEFKIEGCVWDDLKLKRVNVAKDFLLDEKNVYASSDSFPEDNVDESFKSFCKGFRLVCGTSNEQGLDDAIVEIWRNMFYDNNQLVANQRKSDVEEHMVTDKLFKTNFDWLMDPFAQPLNSSDIKASLENIEGLYEVRAYL
ncbi:uncharacterized protein LOC118463371 [Anopheles albimanus]|uniref:uncharacterized protein LOC118463371 n=1 Tax=Anopheles albimanus TaxID=7167 RepID=UPI00163E1F80|nr:uncharacterized protein LOC118463371 [Anopheles albimanus]